MWRRLSPLSIWVSWWECSRLEVGGSSIAQPLKSFFLFWVVEQIYWNNRLCMSVHWRRSIFWFLDFPEVANILVSWISCFMSVVSFNGSVYLIECDILCVGVSPVMELKTPQVFIFPTLMCRRIYTCKNKMQSQNLCLQNVFRVSK